MRKYAISIKWSDEDKGFIATIPEIQALSAFGTTREQALSELKIAAEAYLESLKNAGKQLPSEDKIVSYSGQIRLRMPKSLHAALSNEAKGEGVSLNTFIVTLLSERHIGEQLSRKIEAIEKILGVTNSRIVVDAHDTIQPIRRIEESIGGYRDRKTKK